MLVLIFILTLLYLFTGIVRNIIFIVDYCIKFESKMDKTKKKKLI